MGANLVFEASVTNIRLLGTQGRTAGGEGGGGEGEGEGGGLGFGDGGGGGEKGTADGGGRSGDGGPNGIWGGKGGWNLPNPDVWTVSGTTDEKSAVVLVYSVPLYTRRWSVSERTSTSK